MAIHSFTGCAFYGAFVAKVILVRSRRLPGWTLPVMGSLLVCGIALLWYTAVQHWFNGNWTLWPVIGLVVALGIDVSPATRGAPRRRRQTS